MSDDAAPTCQDDAADGGPGFPAVARLQAWGRANLVPINASIELTLRCNIRCLHCYNFDRDEPRPACDAPELTTAEIVRVMDELRDAGTLFLNLTGGEVLSHPELFTFLDHARKLHLAVTLLTNGTMLRPGVAARLAAYENLLCVSVSLYGATAEAHDTVTQMPGSWRRTWDGVRRLRGLGVAVRLKFIVMKQNAHEVGAMRAQADREGLPYLVDVIITARHDGTKGSTETRLDRPALEGLYRGPLRDLAKRRNPRAITDDGWACNCARGNVGITATGDVHPCTSVPLPAGNVRERPFREIWAGSPVFQTIRGLKLSDYEHCAPCDHKEHCMRSPGAAVTASGRYTGIDPYVCTIAEVAHGLADEAESAEARADEAAPAPVRRLAIAR